MHSIEVWRCMPTMSALCRPQPLSHCCARLLSALDFFLSSSLCPSSNRLFACLQTCMLRKALRTSTSLKGDSIEKVDQAGGMHAAQHHILAAMIASGCNAALPRHLLHVDLHSAREGSQSGRGVSIVLSWYQLPQITKSDRPMLDVKQGIGDSPVHHPVRRQGKPEEFPTDIFDLDTLQWFSDA